MPVEKVTGIGKKSIYSPSAYVKESFRVSELFVSNVALALKAYRRNCVLQLYYAKRYYRKYNPH